MSRPRLAVRGVIVHENCLLLVNAWGGDQSPLWCAPGGGVEVGQSLPDNLAREVSEETGLQIQVGDPCLVNEFHDPTRAFHQVEVFFRCTLIGTPKITLEDPEGIVNRVKWATRAEIPTLMLRPKSLPDVAWGTGIAYDPLERIVK